MSAAVRAKIVELHHSHDTAPCFKAGQFKSLQRLKRRTVTTNGGSGTNRTSPSRNASSSDTFVHSAGFMSYVTPQTVELGIPGARVQEAGQRLVLRFFVYLRDLNSFHGTPNRHGAKLPL